MCGFPVFSMFTETTTARYSLHHFIQKNELSISRLGIVIRASFLLHARHNLDHVPNSAQSTLQFLNGCQRASTLGFQNQFVLMYVERSKMHKIRHHLLQKLFRRQRVQLIFGQQEPPLFVLVAAVSRRRYNIHRWSSTRMCVESQMRQRRRVTSLLAIVDWFECTHICVGLDRTQSLLEKNKRLFTHTLRVEHNTHMVMNRVILDGAKVGKIIGDRANKVWIVHLFFLLIAQIKSLHVQIVFNRRTSSTRHTSWRCRLQRAVAAFTMTIEVAAVAERRQWRR
mmetsp:Transcript_39072/g.63896  ORF Transcript_39072/g.63896 Transcript_39072/m.63896 type:complete len:282 (-) Transcript_39072:2218-3063(-)